MISVYQTKKMSMMKIVGLQLAVGKLGRILKEKKNKVSDSIHKAGFLVEAEVKESIAGRRSEPRSVDTGRFLNSVNVDNSKKMESTIKSNVEYAGILEKGTSTRGARHHFENSGKRKKPEIISMIKKAVS